MHLRRILAFFKGLLTLVVAVGSLLLMVFPLAGFLLGNSSTEILESVSTVKAAIVDRYDMFMNNKVSSALEGVLAVDKVYWLNDYDLIAPEPDQTKYSTCKTPDEIRAFLDSAQKLLGGQKTLFSPETPIARSTHATTYLDETIMAVTWKQVIDKRVYTFSEVKIAHPSQLRRFLAGGAYGSAIQLTPRTMAKSVNAVVGSAGDFYKFRSEGVVVHEGVVRKGNDNRVDTCYIDRNGDLLFTYRGRFSSNEELQRYVDENGIRFSISFGPVLVENGERVPIPEYYELGEIYDPYARAVLCQLDELHYLVLTVNIDLGYTEVLNLPQLQKQIMKLGVRHAYTLDGGQTGTIVMNDRVMNLVEQRKISDIFYFATAIPEQPAQAVPPGA